VRLVELNSAIVNYLNNNLHNPHGTGRWVYVDYPRVDATFPRVSVTQISGNLLPIGIGDIVYEGASNTLGLLFTVEYDIDIWTKPTNSATFNGSVYKGTKLRDYIADDVIQTLTEGKETLRSTYGIVDVEIVGMTTAPLDEENMILRKTISIRVTSIREKAS